MTAAARRHSQQHHYFQGSGTVVSPSAEGMISYAFVNDERLAKYSESLWVARCAGRIVGYLHTMCSILAFCNLTWATVVLLGSFVSSLNPADYYTVFTLLLLEATRLASTVFFIQLLTRSPNPGHFHSYQLPSRSARKERLTFLFRLLSPLLQVLLIVPSFACSAYRYPRIRYPQDSNPNLQTSLRIFYTLVLVHAAICTIMLALSFAAWLYFEQLEEKSVLKYFDEVLHNTLVKGVVRADDFNFFHFSFGLLGREYAHYKSWERVLKNHGGLLRYLYSHKQGADYLMACLESEDAAVQQAAANTVGAWAQEIEEVQLPAELLATLADKVGTGEVGWAAVNSFGALARRSPGCVMKMMNSNGESVLHSIVELVNRYNGSRSLASIRTLILFCDKLMATAKADKSMAAWDLESTLIKTQLGEELTCLLQESTVQRLRVQAAYLLYILGLAHVHDIEFRNHVASIIPTNDRHWFQDEKQMLEHLLGQMHLSSPVSGYPRDLRPNLYTPLTPTRLATLINGQFV